MLDKRPILLSAAMALALVAACDDDDDGNTVIRDGGVADGGGLDASSDAGLDASRDASSASSDAAITLTLGQVVRVASAVNQGEISTSQLAVSRADDARVLAFANMMISAHTTAQQRQTMLATQQSITPSDSAVSATVEAAVGALSTALQASPDATFDLTYMRGQETLHQRTLELIDTSLLPSVSGNTALTAELTQTRAEVAAHLTEARTVIDQID